MKPDGYYLRLIAIGIGQTPNGGGQLDPFRVPIGSGKMGTGLEILDLGERGLILGTLFDTSGRRVTSVSTETAQQWCTSGGTALLADYWGSYLALLRTDRGLIVLRDPSGAFPCYWMLDHGAVLIASDMAWAQAAGAMFGGIDWTEIRAQLQYRHRRSVRTALMDVAELLPGCALRLGGGDVACETLWTPYAHARWKADLPFEEAADRVRVAVRGTLAAEARRCVRPLIALSGGLDSSIVTACFAEANPATECLTFRGGDADLDESSYAQAVADRYGVKLHCERLDTRLVDLHHSAAADLPYPTARSFAQADDRQTRAVAEQIGADAFAHGNGGDNIFWYFNTATAAIDRLRAQGLGAALETASDLALLCDVPRRRVLALAGRKLLRHRIQPWPQSNLLLAGEARDAAEVPPHPWEDVPSDAPLGVQAYVRAMIQLQDHHGYFDRADFAPVRSVLIAQPIFEACLGIPSWLSVKDGRNRAVARAAFADMLPPVTTRRQFKGGFDGFVHEMLATNIPIARDLLLGGMLAERGFIDLPVIDHLLRPGSQIPGEGGLRVLRLVAVEAWLRLQRARGRC
jgi:asparagine synthase (glutamine-hydrolysing)